MTENVVWHAHPVTQQQREQHHGHRGVVLWFTGLPGSGKSTVAGALEEALHERGVSTYLLDGDNVRHGLCSDTGFSDEDRQREHSPRRRSGQADGRCRAGGIDGIYISAPCGTARWCASASGKDALSKCSSIPPLAICEARDPKGLYKKARAGELRNFTGIDSVYEAPEKAEIHLDGETIGNKFGAPTIRPAATERYYQILKRQRHRGVPVARSRIRYAQYPEPRYYSFRTASGDRRRDHLVFVGRCRGLYFVAAGAGYSLPSNGSNTLFFLLYTWPFFLALMPVAVVVGIALHSLLNGKLLYSVSATILTVGLMFALLFLWLLG